MKVVHLTDTTLSASPYRLMKVQRIADVDARCIHGSATTGLRTTWVDLLVTDTGKREEILSVLRAADVIHFHNRCWKQKLFQVIPEALAIVRKKPQVLQYHSPRDQLLLDTPESFSIKCPKLVVAQYQVRLYPGAHIVPNVIPIDDQWHNVFRVAPIWGQKTKIGYSPSMFRDHGWDNKGYKVTTAALKNMATSNKATYEIYKNLPLDDCLTSRKSCDIVIDEVMTGSYHMVSLEALAAAQVTIANLDSRTIDALEYITGTRKHPWIVADAKNLYNTLRDLCGDRSRMDDIRIASRKYMEKYWDPVRVTKFYTDIYKDLI